MTVQPSGLVSRFAGAALALAGWMLPAAAQDVAIVTNRVVYPGETIAADTLREVTLKPGRQVPAAVVTASAEVEGMVARRTLLPGRYIPLASIRQAYLIEQGAPVQVVFIHQGLTISASAVTLQPGSAGDQVRVRNVDSGAIFVGIVMADGTVRVGAS